MRFYFIGKAKNLTRGVIARLFWQSLMSYTKPYITALPKNTRN